MVISPVKTVIELNMKLILMWTDIIVALTEDSFFLLLQDE